jgi:O-antigen/teichoic acid export membrane protein
MDYVWTLISRILLRAGAFFTLIILAKVLNASDLGIYGIIITASYFSIYLGSVGMRHALAFSIGQQGFNVRKVVAYIFTVGVILAVISSFAVAGVYTYYFQYPPELTLLASILVVPMMLLYISQGYFLGVSNFNAFNIYEVLPRLVTLLLVCGAALAVGLTLEQAIAFTAGGFVVSSILLIVRLSSSLGVSIWRAKANEVWGMVRYGSPLTVAMAATMLAPLSVMAILGGELDPEAIGIFFLAYKLVDVFGEAATAVGMVSFGKVVSSAVSSSAFLRAVRVAKFIVIMATLVALAIFLIPDSVYLYFLGSTYGGISEITSILCLGLPMICYNRIVNPAIAALGHPRIGLYSQLTSLIVCVAVSLWVVEPYGLLGCAYAVVLSRMVASVIFACFAHTSLHVSYRRMFFISKLELRYLVLSVRKISGRLFKKVARTRH